MREKEELERRLEGADGIRKAAEAREAKTEEELRKVQQDLELSQEEVKILEKRCDNTTHTCVARSSSPSHLIIENYRWPSGLYSPLHI